MAHYLGVRVGPEISRTEVPNMQPLEIHAGKARLVSINPVDVLGRPAPIDGMVNFDPVSGDAIAVRQSDNSAFIVAVAPAQFDSTKPITIIKISADADLTPNQPGGAGVQTIEDTLEVTTINPLAVALGVTVGEEINAADVPAPPVGGQGARSAAPKAPTGKKY